MPRVGLIGLGNMGLAFAERLLTAGHEVVGSDVAAEARAAFAGIGGVDAGSAGAVARSDVAVAILSLPGPTALHDVVDELCAGAGPAAVLAETSTIGVPDKLTARDRLATAGMTLLDCPVSGTPESVREGRLALFGGGDPRTFAAVEHVLRDIAPHTRHVGKFGNATKLKLICNLLVVIHNAATAEAMALAEAAGFDLELVHEVVSSGVASSRIWELRGAMMAAGDYRPGAFGYRIAHKDGALITSFARDAGSYSPLLAQALELHEAGRAMGLEELDLASLVEVYRALAGRRGDRGRRR